LSSRPVAPSGPVPVSEILRLALPSSAVFLLATLLALLTIRFASTLGPDAVAAVNAGNRLYNVFLAMAAGVNAGALALIANAWGAGRRTEAGQYLQVAMALGTLLGAALTLVIWLCAPTLIGLFTLEPRAHAAAVSYTRWMALFYAPMALGLVLASGLRAAGDVRTPVLIALLMNGLCLWLAWRWIHVPPLGLRPGVHFIALGIGTGNTVGALLGFALWRRSRLLLGPVRQDARARERLAALWSVGYPTALEQGLLQTGIVAFLWVVARYGDAAFAAYGSSISLLAVAMVVGFGFSIAVSVLVGQQLGAGSVINARLVAVRALWVTLAVLSVPAALLAWHAREFALWLTGDARIAADMVLVIYAFTAALPMLAVEFCLGGALRGAGDTRFPLLNVVFGLFVVRFGLAAVLSGAGAGVGWIYATVIADYAVKNVLLIWRFRSDRWMKLYRAPVHGDTRPRSVTE